MLKQGENLDNNELWLLRESDCEFLSYKLMLNSGEKKYSNSRVVRKKFFGTKQKP
jgi:hypothetical protein